MFPLTFQPSLVCLAFFCQLPSVFRLTTNPAEMSLCSSLWRSDLRHLVILGAGPQQGWVEPTCGLEPEDEWQAERAPHTQSWTEWTPEMCSEFSCCQTDCIHSGILVWIVILWGTTIQKSKYVYLAIQKWLLQLSKNQIFFIFNSKWNKIFWKNIILKWCANIINLASHLTKIL